LTIFAPSNAAFASKPWSDWVVNPARLGLAELLRRHTLSGSHWSSKSFVPETLQALSGTSVQVLWNQKLVVADGIYANILEADSGSLAVVVHVIDQLLAPAPVVETGTMAPKPECSDTNDLCSLWREAGDCDGAREYMHLYCRRSCGLCTDATEVGCLAASSQDGCVRPCKWVASKCLNEYLHSSNGSSSGSGVPDSACTMENVIHISTASDPAAAVMGLMQSAPVCAQCILHCASAVDTDSCVMGCVHSGNSSSSGGSGGSGNGGGSNGGSGSGSNGGSGSGRTDADCTSLDAIVCMNQCSACWNADPMLGAEAGVSV
jgi:hypothetical protein